MQHFTYHIDLSIEHEKINEGYEAEITVGFNIDRVGGRRELNDWEVIHSYDEPNLDLVIDVIRENKDLEIGILEDLEYYVNNEFIRH